MPSYTRRKFIETSSAGLLSLAGARAANRLASNTESPGEIKVHVTAGTRRFAPGSPLERRAARGATDAGILRNWARCIIGWNLALDEQGKPNIGPFECGGMITIDSKTKEITRSGQYWAFAHYSRGARCGALRVQSAGEIEGVSHVAFANPDGSKVVIVTNAGSDRQVSLRIPGSEAEIMLPENSITNPNWA